MSLPSDWPQGLDFFALGNPRTWRTLPIKVAAEAGAPRSMGWMPLGGCLAARGLNNSG